MNPYTWPFVTVACLLAIGFYLGLFRMAFGRAFSLKKAVVVVAVLIALFVGFKHYEDVAYARDIQNVGVI